jgi:hypothetical protein
VIYFAWYFVNSSEIKSGKQLMKRNTRIIVLKLKIKMYIVLVLHSLIKVYLKLMSFLFIYPKPQCVHNCLYNNYSYSHLKF